jgi:hypothetical protein
MPFNPDEYLAKKQVETSGNSAPQPAFDPDAYLQTKGVQTLPNQGGIEDGASTAKALQAEQMQKNPPTPLSGLVHGFEQGYTYNHADNAASAIGDPAAKARMDNSKQEYPVWYSLANLAGAILSPNPLTKLKPAVDAGILAKTLYNAGNFGTQVGLASLGESDKQGSGKLEDVKNTFENPLILGLGALATLGPASEALVKGLSGKIVKGGDTAYGLGKGLKQTLGSEQGQELVTKAVNGFEEDAGRAVDQARSVVGQKLDEIAAKNEMTTASFKPIAEKTLNIINDFKPDESLPNEGIASNILKSWYERNSSKMQNLDQAPFSALYDAKKELGDLLFKSKARVFNSSPEMQRQAIQVWDQLSKTLSKADVTGGFQDVSQAFSGLYKTQGALDGLGTTLGRAGDKLNLGADKKISAILKSFNSVPEAYRKLAPELDQAINQNMPQLINAYSTAAKVAGKSPIQGATISELANKLPLISPRSRLGALNRLGVEAAGAARPALTTVINPAGPATLAGRALGTALTPSN